jgi:hypothetical protein
MTREHEKIGGAKANPPLPQSYADWCREQDRKKERRVIAAAALQGLVSCAWTDGWSAQERAESAVDHADALLAQLDKTEE